jgi:hypothetical protein
MTRLDVWLGQATRHLSKNSVDRVRNEIGEHYEAAREAALGDGASEDEADRVAVNALGKATTANRQYRKVLLTSAEAKMLRNGNWEARAVCARPWLKSLLLAIPATAVLAAVVLFLNGATDMARLLLMGGLGVGFVLAMPFLPIYTPARSRVLRVVKYAVLFGMVVLPFGADALRWSWLVCSCLWPVMWIEWTRMSIRRKLPVAEWPKNLYL